MSEQVITTKRGTFGKVQVTLPMHIKNSMMAWMKRSGLGKAEFFRVALMIGAAQLAKNIQAKQPEEGYGLSDIQATTEPQEVGRLNKLTPLY